MNQFQAAKQWVALARFRNPWLLVDGSARVAPSAIFRREPYWHENRNPPANRRPVYRVRNVWSWRLRYRSEEARPWGCRRGHWGKILPEGPQARGLCRKQPDVCPNVHDDIPRAELLQTDIVNAKTKHFEHGKPVAGCGGFRFSCQYGFNDGILALGATRADPSPTTMDF